MTCSLPHGSARTCYSTGKMVSPPRRKHLSWPITPPRLYTGPFSLCLALWLQWRLVVQDFFGSRYVARLSGRQTYRQLGGSGEPGFISAVLCFNQTISVAFYNSKEGPLQVFEAVPLLSTTHIMASGDTCPLLAILVWSQPMG